jgi:hypothetical protein
MVSFWSSVSRVSAVGASGGGLRSPSLSMRCTRPLFERFRSMNTSLRSRKQVNLWPIRGAEVSVASRSDGCFAVRQNLLRIAVREAEPAAYRWTGVADPLGFERKADRPRAFTVQTPIGLQRRGRTSWKPGLGHRARVGSYRLGGLRACLTPSRNMLAGPNGQPMLVYRCKHHRCRHVSRRSLRFHDSPSICTASRRSTDTAWPSRRRCGRRNGWQSGPARRSAANRSPGDCRGHHRRRAGNGRSALLAGLA